MTNVVLKPRLNTNNEHVVIKVSGAPLEAYIAYPSRTKAPAVIVVHEIWGLNDQTRGVADRLAAEGYLALAPDLMKGEMTDFVDASIHRELADPATRDEAQKKMRAALAPVSTPGFGARTVKKLKACYDFLKNHTNSDGTVGIVGFCFGGTYSFALAAAEPALKFATPFYGTPPKQEDIPKIKCPVLAFYGDKDERLMEGLPALTEEMKKANKNFRSIVYPGVGHAFFNEKNERMYNADAAAKAWQELKKFLKANTSA
ncbi:MAG TPA: dienelactone hydrolase family protein [Candidatus Paceibacterota bacterium]|nr:dienelactone hydrolase family protein [Candidatus Paceibacterota bacterium]